MGTIIWMAGFFISCETKTTEKKFFDIPGYFKEEIEYITMLHSTVKKTSIYNGKKTEEQKKTIDVNWKKEWQFFLQADINKPVYIANMQQHDLSDSIQKRILYTSNSSKTTIQRVELVWGFLNKNVDIVSISTRKNNLISSSEMMGIYIRGKRYFISGTQRTKYIGSSTSFSVEGFFDQ